VDILKTAKALDLTVPPAVLAESSARCSSTRSRSIASARRGFRGHQRGRVPGLENRLSGAHSQAMDRIILFKILDFLIAICVASMVALTLGFVAHYVFGVSRLDIRRSALMGAAIFALLVSTGWLNKKSQ
jgi:hypothetical protein